MTPETPIDLWIHTESGDVDRVETSEAIKCGEFVRRYLRFKLEDPSSRHYAEDPDRPSQWNLRDRETGNLLDCEKTLAQNGIRNGKHLFLVRVKSQSDFTLEIILPHGKSHQVDVSPEMLVAEFTRGLLKQHDLPPDGWVLSFDPQKARVLDPDKTFANAGVLPAQRLFLLGTSRTTGWPTILAILVVLLLAGELAYVGYLRGWLVTVTIQQQGPIKLSPGRSQQFTAVVKYTRNQRVLWWIDPSVGVISDSGLYTAPASLGPQRQVNIVAASEQYPNKKAIVQVKLLSPPLAISGKQTLPPGESAQFVAKAGDDVVKEVYWSLDPSDASSGTINNEGLYTAPPSAAAQKTITVIATSQAEPENSAKSTITIIQAELAISPGSATLQPSQPTTFTAMSGSNPAAVVWSINPQGIGAITQAGVYTAPAIIAAGQTVTVIATSRTNPAVSAHATISLVRGGAPLTFSVAPGHVDLGAMDEQQFEIAPKPGEQIQWSHPALGRISPQGKYTAPPMVHGSQQITIIATVEGSPARAAVITLHPVEVSQPSCVLASHSQYHCSAPVRYAPPQREGVSWSITPEFGSISQADGVYTAPAAIPNDMDVTVIAKSLFDPIASNRQIIHLPRIPVKVRRNVRIVMSSSHPQVLMNLQRARFSATVTGSDNSGVSWTVDGPGTIDQQSGVYLAPGYIHDGDTVRVTAASNADPSQVATTTLTLRNYTGPDIGTIHWKNETDINQALTIEGTQVSTGTLIGQAWPPVTVQIDNIPGWTIVEPPSIENDWKRLVIRPKNGAKHKVSITWRVNHYH